MSIFYAQQLFLKKWNSSPVAECKYKKKDENEHYFRVYILHYNTYIPDLPQLGYIIIRAKTTLCPLKY